MSNDDLVRIIAAILASRSGHEARGLEPTELVRHYHQTYDALVKAESVRR